MIKFSDILFFLKKGNTEIPTIVKHSFPRQRPIYSDSAQAQAAAARNEEAFKDRSTLPYHPTRLEFFAAAALSGAMARDISLTDSIYLEAIENAQKMIIELDKHEIAKCQEKACQDSPSAKRTGRDVVGAHESIVIHPEFKTSPAKES